MTRLICWLMGHAGTGYEDMGLQDAYPCRRCHRTLLWYRWL